MRVTECDTDESSCSGSAIVRIPIRAGNWMDEGSFESKEIWRHRGQKNQFPLLVRRTKCMHMRMMDVINSRSFPKAQHHLYRLPQQCIISTPSPSYWLHSQAPLRRMYLSTRISRDQTLTNPTLCRFGATILTSFATASPATVS